jgi:predicted choloylglycine hydrolase
MSKRVAISGGPIALLVLVGMSVGKPSQGPASPKQALIRDQVIAGGPHDFMEVRHLVLRGSNQEIGRALAAVAREQHRLKPAASSDPLRTRARNHYLERQYPILFERMRGVAEFYGERPDDDALDFSALRYVKMRPGCSVVYYPPGLTADNVGVVSRNSDYSTGTLWGAWPGPGQLPAAARPYLIEMHPDRGYASLALCAGDLLSGVLDGMNSAGLTVALLADGGERGDPAAEPAFDTGVGLGAFQMQRYLLDTCATTAEAKEALLTTKQYYEFIRCKYLVADRHGTAFIWELSPAANREYILETPGKPLITTNFSLHRHLEGRNLPSVEGAREICSAYSALAEGVATHTGKFTSDAIKAVHQVAACTEPAAPESGRPPTRTHWHALYYPERRKLQVSFYLGEKSGASGSGNGGILRSDYLEFTLSEGGGDK